MKYQFLWRRDGDKVTPFHSKTVSANNDDDAIDKMVRHVESKLEGHVDGIEIDYEMARMDVPYDHTRHAATFIDLCPMRPRIESYAIRLSC